MDRVRRWDEIPETLQVPAADVADWLATHNVSPSVHRWRQKVAAGLGCRVGILEPEDTTWEGLYVRCRMHPVPGKPYCWLHAEPFGEKYTRKPRQRCKSVVWQWGPFVKLCNRLPDSPEQRCCSRHRFGRGRGGA